MKRNAIICCLSLFTFLGAASCHKKMPAGDTPVVNVMAGSKTEAHRPQFHFSPPAKWMNDPNGMVYHNGEYHLFYQHNPDTTIWAPMHWGHAVSKDLVSWEHLPIALYPDSLGMIFSGSAVVDAQNTSGLGTQNNPPLVAIYTYHLLADEQAGRSDYQTQGLAYSLDQGRTWTKYAQNPVLHNPGIRDFRDPKVSWHQASQQWVMALAVADHIEFYGSRNLINWEKRSQFGGKGVGAHGGVWECPDLFPLQVNGEQKWVLVVSINPGGPQGGSATQYFVGQFDGQEFKSDNKPETTLWLDHGADNYAGVTWSNIPASDGRRLFIGWMSNWQYANVVPTETWRSAATLPRELRLAKTPAGIRLTSAPVKELQKLRTAAKTIKAQPITGTVDLPKTYDLKMPLLELDLNFDVSKGEEIVLKVANALGEHINVGYSVTTKQLYIDRSGSGKVHFEKGFAALHTAPLSLENGKLKLHIFLDAASIEVFANDGQVVMTDIFFPTEDFTKVDLSAKGTCTLEESQAYSLRSIWK